MRKSVDWPPPVDKQHPNASKPLARATEAIQNQAQPVLEIRSITFGCFFLSRVRCAGWMMRDCELRLKRQLSSASVWLPGFLHCKD